MTRFAISLLLFASCAVGQPPGGPPHGGGPPAIFNLPEMINYPLTMDKVEKWSAANKSLIVYVRDHPEIQQKTRQDFSQAKSLDELVALAKSHAGEYVRVIESSGLGFREYLLVTGALVSAFIGEAMQERAQDHAPPSNAANIAFVKVNKDRIQAMFNEYSQMSRPAPHPSH